MSKAKKPIDAKTFSQICSLPRDHYETKNHWLLLDTGVVYLHRQKSGHESEASLKIPRAEFDRMVRWYVTGRATPR